MTDFLTIDGPTCDVYAEHSMRSRRLLIELSFSNNPLVITLPHVLEHLLSGSDITFTKSVDVDPLGYTFSDFEILIIWIN